MIKTVDDYLEAVHEKFPSISTGEIKKILNFGFRIYSYVNRRGADVLIKSDYSREENIIAMTGGIRKDPLDHYINGLFKWRMKERILYSFRNTKWDGYYYFGIADEHHHKLLDQLNNKRLRNIRLDHVFLYKAPKEIYHDHYIDHVYKIKYPMEFGYKIYNKKFNEKKKDIEYVGINKESTWYRNLQMSSQED